MSIPPKNKPEQPPFLSSHLVKRATPTNGKTKQKTRTKHPTQLTTRHSENPSQNSRSHDWLATANLQLDPNHVPFLFCCLILPTNREGQPNPAQLQSNNQISHTRARNRSHFSHDERSENAKLLATRTRRQGALVVIVVAVVVVGDAVINRGWKTTARAFLFPEHCETCES